jgi:hypothetical protein
MGQSSFLCDFFFFINKWKQQPCLRYLLQVNCYDSEHDLQLRAHSCSLQLINTTYFQLLCMHGHVFSYSDAPALHEMSGFHSGRYEDDCLLRCCYM